VLGDVLTQRVLLQIDGKEFEPAKLPPSQRVGIWLERHPSRIESASDGRRWLAIEYQVINAPHDLTTINLPTLALTSRQGDTRLGVPGLTVSVGALTPRSAFGEVGFGELRPDRQPTVIATAPIQKQLLFWSLALVLTLAAWFAWLKWRDHLAAANQPFARAWHDMQNLGDAAPQAWQALHRAFDRTAGQVMHAQTLPVLFQRAPQLQPLQAQIERFFAASSERFFGAGTPDASVSVRSLCEELRRVERRHER
jgi:mxaA protein